MPPVISVEHLSKAYRLGQIGTGTFANDLKLWWAKMRGKPNPLLKIGETDHGNRDGEEIWALRDVSFTVEQGEVLGIIGRNGAGKSTLLKILSRVTAPTSGEIKVKGRVASLLEVGTGFHPELTGRENIYLNGSILGMSRKEIDRKFDEIVGFAEVEKFIDTPVKRYSSGMYVRLAFAVAAHLDSEILIVDEVLAVGDAAFQKKSLSKMGDVAKEGRTVLFVSHSMAAIKNLCNQGMLLDKGTISDRGEVVKVVDRYLNDRMQMKSSITWQTDKRPTNNLIAVEAVRLKNINNEAIDFVNISEDAVIEIDYEVIVPNTMAGFSLAFIDSGGNHVFVSMSNLEDCYYGKPLDKGHYRSSCYVYGNLLSPGVYSVFIYGFSSHWKDGFRVYPTINVKAVDDGVLRGDYFHPTYLGIVRPKLAWKTILLNGSLC